MTKTFSNSEGYFLTLLGISYSVTIYFYFMQHYFLYMNFLSLVSCFRNSLAYASVEYFPRSRPLQFTQEVFDSLLIGFSTVRDGNRVPFSTHKYADFPALLVEDVFLHICFWATVKTQVIVTGWVNFWMLYSIPLLHVPVFCARVLFLLLWLHSILWI